MGVNARVILRCVRYATFYDERMQTNYHCTFEQLHTVNLPHGCLNLSVPLFILIYYLFYLSAYLYHVCSDFRLCYIAGLNSLSILAAEG